MSLNNGGHLTHGSSVNFSGKLFDMKFYDVDAQGFIDFADVEQKAAEYKPKLILAGASAYSRVIDFARFADIAKSVGAYFMVDMAHIAVSSRQGTTRRVRTRRHHHDHDAQNAARAARRHDLL